MSDLHIPNLTIKNFRGIEELEVPRLGRVTLIVGRNSVGKTTILDAIRTYAERGTVTSLMDMLRSRDEVVTVQDEDGDEVSEPDWPAMFRNRYVARPISISATSPGGTNELIIELAPSESRDGEDEMEGDPATDGTAALRIRFAGDVHDVPWLTMPGAIPGVRLPPIRDRSRYLRRLRLQGLQGAPGWPFPRLVTESLGPHIPDNSDLARYWDQIALTDAERVAFEALELASGTQVRGAAVVGDRDSYRLGSRDRLVIGLADGGQRVPLRRLGEGSVRLFGLALALANCRGGVLLVDEIENGVHYGIMSQMWQIILKLARENAVQVVATTHGWDCVWALANIAISEREKDIIALRIEEVDGAMRLTEFDERDFGEIAKQQLEIR